MNRTALNATHFVPRTRCKAPFRGRNPVAPAVYGGAVAGSYSTHSQIPNHRRKEVHAQ